MKGIEPLVSTADPNVARTQFAKRFFSQQAPSKGAFLQDDATGVAIMLTDRAIPSPVSGTAKLGHCRYDPDAVLSFNVRFMKAIFIYRLFVERAFYPPSSEGNPFVEH